MPAITATAPGKIILFGEHAVVYGRPAIAVPVTQVAARAVCRAAPRGAAGSVHLVAPQIGLEADLAELPEDHPLSRALEAVLAALEVRQPPACTLRVTSTIPIAAGMGSGAAVAVAVIRAFSAFLGQPLPAEKVSGLAFEVEKVHHGTPSGIDNTVVTYAKPIYFLKGRPHEALSVPQPFTLVIADTGIASPTAETVGEVRRAWRADPEPYERIFDAIGVLVGEARQAIEGGRPETLGPLMDENQRRLQELGVSSPLLDCLAEEARAAGALGAKLSGGGRGGNLIALVDPERAAEVARSLGRAGAVRTLATRVSDRAGGVETE